MRKTNELSLNQHKKVRDVHRMFTAREKYEDALREMKLRERVYDRMVNVGRMSKELAARRIDIMSEIAADYHEVMRQEDLFSEDTIPAPRAKAHRRDPRPPRDAGSNRVGEGAAEEPQSAGPTQTDSGRAGDVHAGTTGDLPTDAGRAGG